MDIVVQMDPMEITEDESEVAGDGYNSAAGPKSLEKRDGNRNEGLCRLFL
jgi:hypothetical protein